ncbi:hypothetical protein QWY99_08475 [Flavobacterium branchiarum]|uniref:Lipoprotein n=1 Tax=Flavobacterium branchiarum TaxID=1114870 RepID=A0ABV5FPT0_9FLAO|nr:hypothetical protein [Flavobacterium branchiarum]MDN3673081.1 hypothetical protein [Flavobacterium branchiarum]
MYKTIVLVLVCLCCFLTSCRTSRQETQKHTSIAETIILQKETYRDTVLFTPKAETSLKIPVTELVFKEGLNSISKPKTFTQKNGNATAKIIIQQDTVMIIATCDSLALVAKIKKELYKATSAKARSDVENTKTKTGYSLFDLLMAFLIGLSLGAVTTFILKNFKIV